MLEDRALDVAVDAFGHLLMVGQSVDPANGMLGSQSDQISFAALDNLQDLTEGFGQAGKFSWAQGNGEDAGGTAMCLTPDGQIVVAGYLVDTAGGNFADLIFLRLGNGVTTTAAPEATENDELDLDRLSIYPNPSSERIFIQGKHQNNPADVVELSGKIVMRQTSLSGGIDVSDLPSGMYYVRMREGNLPFIKR
ncbi:MAG: T9SS type A sorting domain-containing protein [Bacteroidota bacterium]